MSNLSIPAMTFNILVSVCVLPKVISTKKLEEDLLQKYFSSKNVRLIIIFEKPHV